MTDIYIHVGTHKTGSTTIQQALGATTESSLIEGWRHIGTPRTAKDFMRAEKYDKILVRRFRDELQSIIQRGKSADRFVLSSEALSGLPNNGYQNSNIVSSMLRDATAQYNVKIVIYLRRQDDFVESMYTQNIHEGETLDFMNFMKYYDSPDALNYSRILNDFGTSFGEQNLVVKSYHEASNRGLLADFGEVIKSKSLPNSGQKRWNPSYSRHALEIARICNLYLDEGQKGQLRQVLQTTMAKDRLELFSFFTVEERTRFLQKYELSNRDVVDC